MTSRSSIVDIRIEEKDNKYILHLSGSNQKHVKQLYDLLLTDLNEISNSKYRFIIKQNFKPYDNPFSPDGDDSSRRSSSARNDVKSRSVETDILPTGKIIISNGIIKPQSVIEKFHKLIQDFLFYGDNKKLICFTTSWIERNFTPSPNNEQNDNIIKAKIIDPPTEEDNRQLDNIIQSMINKNYDNDKIN